MVPSYAKFRDAGVNIAIGTDAAFANAQLALDGDEAALARAIDQYQEALGRRPEYAIHWANLALLEYRAGMTEAALDDVVVIPFNDPGHAVAILDEE